MRGDNSISGYASLLFTIEGKFGSRWEFFNLPEAPENGLHIIAYNIDADETRMYYYVGDFWWISELSKVD